MISIEFHFVAWICFVIGIFCAGMWLGYSLADGTTSKSNDRKRVQCCPECGYPLGSKNQCINKLIAHLGDY